MNNPEDFTPPQIDFNLPLPTLGVAGNDRECIGVQLIVSDTYDGKRIKMRFLDTKHRRPDTFELTANLKNGAALGKFISENIPHSGIFGKSDYCTATMSPDGSLFIMLSPKGRTFLEEEPDASFIMDSISGSKLVMHYETIHPTITPPYVTFKWKKEGEKIWYHRPSIKQGELAFKKELLEKGWLKMDSFSK